MSFPMPQIPDDGVADKRTGALTPRLIGQPVVRVNGPKTLLSPSLNLVVRLMTPVPPQHDNGNAVPGKFGPSAASVPRTRLQLSGLTFVITIVASGPPSPFVSPTHVALVLTLVPGLWIGMPVLLTTF